MANVNNQNSHDDYFKKSIEDAIKNLTALELKIDAFNTKMKDTKDHFVDAADGVKEFGESLDKIDGRKTKKLLTLSQNLKDVIANLKWASSLDATAKDFSLLIEKMQELSKIEPDFSKIDKLSESIDNLNNKLVNFLKVSKSLKAVDLEKITNIGVKFDDVSIEPQKKEKKPETESRFVKRIRREGFGDIDIKAFNEANWDNVKNLTNAKNIAKSKLASGEFHKDVDIEKATKEQHVEAVKLYRKYYAELLQDVENNTNSKTDEALAKKKQKQLNELASLELQRTAKTVNSKDIDKFIKKYVDLSIALGELGDTTEDIQKNGLELINKLKEEFKVEDVDLGLSDKDRENQINFAVLEAKRGTKDFGTRDVETYIRLSKVLGKLGSTAEEVEKNTKSLREELNAEIKNIKDETDALEDKEKQKKKEARKEASLQEKIESLKKDLKELEPIIKSGVYNSQQAESYANKKYKTGGYSDGILPDKLTEEQREKAAKLRAEELKELQKNASNTSKKVDYDKKIERLDKERRFRLAQAEANRELISHRTEDRLKKKLADAEAKTKFDENNQVRNALSRLVNNTLGSSSPILQDLAELTPIINKDFKSVQVLKDKRAEINAQYALDSKKIDNDEMTEKQKIRLKGLTAEQKALLDNTNLTEEQRKGILNSADSQEEVLKKLKELDKRIAKEREELNKENTEALIENEELLNNASIKAAGSLAKMAITLKVAQVAIEGIWKASKKAAEANANMVADLKSMGASSNEIDDSSIRFFTNELKNVEQRLKSIGRNFGEILGPVGAGWSMIMDWLLEGIESITDKLAEIPKFFNKDISADSEKSINYSTKVLEGIATKLDKGIDVNGVEVKIDKEVAYRALSNSFGQSKTQGFDNASSANLSSLISNMATQVQANYGVDYTTASSQISDAIFNGSNSASAYGIVIDDQILAGYAAMEKELDLVNVQYTDAYKSALRYEMAEKMMADGNSKEMQDKIKKWKQLGDVIQTASGSLFDFQEVQQIEAKDFTIPDIGAQGGIVDDADKYTELNKQLAESGDMFVMTSKGMMTFQEALDFVNGDLSKFQLLMNKSTGEMILATNDYLPSLTQAEQNLYDTINTGVPAIATYARHIGLTDEQMINLARDSGIAEEKIGALRVALDELTSKGYTANFNYSSITEAKNEALALNEALATAGYLQGGEINVNMPNSYASELSKYTPEIQEYVNNGYKFSDGTTMEDMDGDGKTGFDLGNVWQYITNKEKREAYQAFDRVRLGSKWGGVAYEYGYMDRDDMLGHADGGLSFKEHTARISEGNAKEVILPLNSQETMSTLAGAISMSGILNSGGGVNVENININNDGINIADNNQAWRRVATRLADELSTLQRERGDLNYGIR